MHFGRLAWFSAAVGLTTACHPKKDEPIEPRPKTKHYEVILADNWTTPETANAMDPTVMLPRLTTGSRTVNQVNARFAGKDRSRAKTSISDGGQAEEFLSVADLQASLPADDAMLKNHVPPITRRTADRVPEEQRNVHVQAWLYAIKYEPDNDWHIIAGTDPDAGDARYFNAEVSGLPKQQRGQEAPSYEALLAVRNSLAQILDNDLPGLGSYRRYDPPVAIEIEGSLFYDIDHAPGVVGPSDMKPTTAWEIHPITSLKELTP